MHKHKFALLYNNLSYKERWICTIQQKMHVQNDIVPFFSFDFSGKAIAYFARTKIEGIKRP